MASLNYMGAEMGDFSEIPSVAGTVAVSSAQAHAGTYSYRINPTAGTGILRTRGLVATGNNANLSEANLYTSFQLRIASAPDGTTTICLFRKSNHQIRVKLTASRTLLLYYLNGSDAETQIGSASSAIALDTWVRVEVKGTALATGGSSVVELKLEGSTIATGTSLTVTSSPGNLIASDYGILDSATADIFIDDIIYSNSGYPGEVFISRMGPDGNGNYTAWTGTFADVDEIPHNSDTDFIDSSVAAQAETEALESAESAEIFGTIISAKSIALLRDLGSPSSISVRLRAATTDDDTDAHVSLGAAYRLFAKLYDVNPADSGAWENADLDATEVGVLNNTSGAAIRCTALSLMVVTDTAPFVGPSIPVIQHHRLRNF